MTSSSSPPVSPPPRTTIEPLLTTDVDRNDLVGTGIVMVRLARDRV